MARKFVRNITGTNLGGNKLSENNEKVEPFDTNVQNDILNDDEDIYIRQVRSEKVEDNYHCLTDNLKEVNTTNNIIGTSDTDKNTVQIDPKISTKDEAEKGEANGKIMTPKRTKEAIDKQVPPLVKKHETPTEIQSLSDELKIEKTSKNNFDMKLELSEFATKKYVEDTLDDIEVPEVPEVDLTEYAKAEDLPEYYKINLNPILEIEEFLKIDRNLAQFEGVKNLKDGKQMRAVSSIYINHLLECIHERFLVDNARIQELEKFKNRTTQEMYDIKDSISIMKAELVELKEKVEGGTK